MNITLSSTAVYVILTRNEASSTFYIRPKADIIREVEHKTQVISWQNEGHFSEAQIIEMMKAGSKFCTYSYANNEFTEVFEVDGHIKTVPNDSTKDNIASLPVSI